ncbi:hypothetical protein AVEN_215174-1 [Araneus ventricosus]|uniref:Uncharacterized protein n=1 Tax=Araneus ventricosus TaxID=182803 RepID=A0A4Y2FR67_ARAVE|nr:hypothetical protein AVEN_215174-1 [Araneus ventricosus]
MELRSDDDDDGDSVVEITTSLISHTVGIKTLEAALCYVDQQSSASPTDVMLIKNGETMRQAAELLGFNKKVAHFFNEIVIDDEEIDVACTGSEPGHVAFDEKIQEETDGTIEIIKEKVAA